MLLSIASFALQTSQVLLDDLVDQCPRHLHCFESMRTSMTEGHIGDTEPTLHALVAQGSTSTCQAPHSFHLRTDESGLLVCGGAVGCGPIDAPEGP
ncbi:hypothetical protein M3J09_000930 [Ascochyta lentis]